MERTAVTDIKLALSNIKMLESSGPRDSAIIFLERALERLKGDFTDERP